MTLKIEISAETGHRLKTEAARLGIDEAEYAKRLIEQNVPLTQPLSDQATLDLLAAWDAQDTTSDATEIAQRQQDWEEFKRSMNQNSLSGRPVYP